MYNLISLYEYKIGSQILGQEPERSENMVGAIVISYCYSSSIQNGRDTVSAPPYHFQSLSLQSYKPLW